jgi:hypothetical protein
VLDSIDDNDDIEWPENPFDYREDQNTETPEELLAMIRSELGTNPLRWSL